MGKRMGTLAPYCLLGVGALLVAAGLWRGELAVYFNKAITICLECVGIG